MEGVAAPTGHQRRWSNPIDTGGDRREASWVLRHRPAAHRLDVGRPGRRLEPQTHHLAARAAQRSAHDGTGDGALHRKSHVPRPALRVRLPSPDGDQHAVAGGRGGDVGPPQGAHLAAPHPRHEEQPHDHRNELATLQGKPRRTRRRGRGSTVGGRRREPRPSQPPRRGEPGRDRDGDRDRHRSAGSPRAPALVCSPAGLGAPARRARSAPRPPPSTRSRGLSPARGTRRASRPRERGQPVRKTRSAGAESAVNKCGKRGQQVRWNHRFTSVFKVLRVLPDLPDLPDLSRKGEREEPVAACFCRSRGTPPPDSPSTPDSLIVEHQLCINPQGGGGVCPRSSTP